MVSLVVAEFVFARSASVFVKALMMDCSCGWDGMSMGCPPSYIAGCRVWIFVGWMVILGESRGCCYDVLSLC